MSAAMESESWNAWHIVWGAGRTRRRLLLILLCVILATVFGSLAGLFPEAFLFAALTGNGFAEAGGWGATLAGNLVQLVSVLLALAVLDRVMRRMTPNSAEVDDIDVLDMDESLRRIGRTKFLYLGILTIAIPAQVLVWLGEDFIASQSVWIESALHQTSRFPQAFYLLIADGILIGILRRSLATKQRSSAAPAGP